VISELVVFVTGNANKLREVKAILAAGGTGVEVTSQAVDGQFSGSMHCVALFSVLTFSARAAGNHAGGCHCESQGRC
jgi:hypothetical protein